MNAHNLPPACPFCGADKVGQSKSGKTFEFRCGTSLNTISGERQLQSKNCCQAEIKKLTAELDAIRKPAPAPSMSAGAEPVPLDQSNECVGCGNTKRLRGRDHSSLICCRECWQRLPKWVTEAFTSEASMKWQDRISMLLQWRKESDGQQPAGKEGA